jgi:ABC-type Fe3+/spermidine/putrescine transport system ATPase subunit
LKELQRRAGVTSVLVTHDREESLQLSDRVGVLAAGTLLQTGEPQAVYRHPRCPFVARLLGEANLLAVRSVGADGVRLEGGLVLARLPDQSGRPEVGRPALLRPEACGFVPPGAGQGGWPGRVTASSFLGADQVITVQVAEGVSVRVRARAGTSAPAPGEAVRVVVPPEAVWFIPERDPEGVGDVAR